MNIEGGTISSGSASVPSAGVSAVTSGVATNAASIEMGPVGVGIGNSVNEGPVAPSFLENTMPLSINRFNPAGEIIFNPSSITQQAEEVAAAAWKASEPASVIQETEQVAARTWEAPLASQGETLEAVRSSLVVNSIVKDPEQPAVVSLPNPARGLDVRVITNPFLAPKEESAPQSIVQTRAESRATSAVARVTSTPTKKEVWVEQVVEEKKYVVGDHKKDEPNTKKSEKEAVVKVKFVEAVQVSERRRLEIKAAVKKAKAEVEKSGLRGITGRLVRKLLANTFWEHKSPIVGEGKDGTINPTAEEMERDTTEYKDAKEAEGALVQVVAKHIPIQKGEGGRLATVGEVREVLEGKEKENLRSQTPTEIVISRLVSGNVEVTSTGQVVNTVVEEKEEVVGEPTLKSLGLEELFPKAA